MEEGFPGEAWLPPIGFFTATEAAALGAFVAFLEMFVTRNFKWATLRSAFAETMEVGAMTFVIMVGAAVFVIFISVSGLPRILSGWIATANLSPFLFMIMVVILYFILGCFMPAISILLITMPILFQFLNKCTLISSDLASSSLRWRR